VTMTPDDIENQVFKERFRGYDQDEVDRFLDRVSEQITALAKERDDLQSRLKDLETAADENADQGNLIQRALLTAQRTADETVAEARQTAEQTVSEARQTAEQTVTEAREEADSILTEARQRVEAEEERAHAIFERVRKAVADLHRFRSEYRERVEGVIAEQLSMLDRAGDLPELPAPLENLAHLETPEAEGGERGDVAVSYGGES
jgi:cell division initiation protein